MINTKLQYVNAGDIVGIYSKLGSDFKSFKIVKIDGMAEDYEVLSHGASPLKVTVITYINSIMYNGNRVTSTSADYASTTHMSILYVDVVDKLFILDDDEIEHMVMDLI